MKINIQSVGFTARQQLVALVQKKVEKFKRLCGDVIRIDVQFKLNNAGAAINKLCAIRLVIPGYDLLSHTKSNSFEAAVAIAIEALERQIEKRKKKQRRQVLHTPIPIPAYAWRMK
jgi:putative sigma-54 modulation protein